MALGIRNKLYKEYPIGGFFHNGGSSNPPFRLVGETRTVEYLTGEVARRHDEDGWSAILEHRLWVDTVYLGYLPPQYLS